MKKKILIFASDLLSKSNKYLTGGGLRSLQLIESFKDYFDVEVAVPSDIHQDSFHNYLVSKSSQVALMKETGAEIAYFVNASACCLDESFDYGVDVHGPIFFESALILNDSIDAQLAKYHRILSSSKFITCVTDEQKHALNFLGCISSFQKIFELKVFCIPLDFNRITTNINLSSGGKTVFGYYGSIYPWNNPLPYLAEIGRSLPSNCELKVCSGAHTGLNNYSSVESGLREVGLLRGVRTYGLVTRDTLNNMLASTTFFLDLSVESPERSICASTRTAEMLSIGLPVIVNSNSFFGRVFRSIGLEEFLVSSVEASGGLIDKLSKLNDKDVKEIYLKQNSGYQHFILKNNELNALSEFLKF
jgi:hypothetical protein